MAAFDKATVDVAELSAEELERVSAALGVRGPWEKLSNGGCAANYASAVAVLKAVVGPEAESLALTQLAVLGAVAPSGAGPRPMSASVAACATTKGVKACAVAMERVQGRAVNVLVREGAVDAVEGYGAVGGALGRLHAANPRLDDLPDVADERFVERFLRIDRGVEDELAPHRGDPFVEWVACDDWRRLRDARAALRARDLPRGLLHGDPYPDNAVALVDPDRAVRAVTLIDWEDASCGPLCYDLGCALVAVAFDPERTAETLRSDVARRLLESYLRARPSFSPQEAAALPGLMAANALACALYRWHQFCVLDPDAPPAAKLAHLEMQRAVDALEDPSVASAIHAMALDLMPRATS
mmetsp:Transcript_8751/g.27524  ORF Transcript_8751/g.27524 Transcript_8751/m.27524 type:complete len:357 (-) Transcript_8751:914-1984(-)